MRSIRPRGRDAGNSHNGRPTQLKITVLTEIGRVTIEVPRDTESTFEPQIVKKRQRRLTGIDEIVLSPLTDLDPIGVANRVCHTATRVQIDVARGKGRELLTVLRVQQKKRPALRCFPTRSDPRRRRCSSRSKKPPG